MKILLLLLPLMGCSKYQVVQEVKVNLYHLHNPKTRDVEVIVTQDSLAVGHWYRLNQINIIELENDNK
mgnify:FL=1|jgi:hypothetical protein